MVVDIADIEDPEVAAFAREAESFLLQHSWCERIVSGRKSWAAPGVLGVFHFTIVPSQPDADAELWVVVGDLPSAYIAQPPEASWQDVLAGYIDEMRRWVAAVRAGDPLDDVIPVGVEPTEEHAQMLESRLDFLERELVNVPANSLDDVS